MTTTNLIKRARRIALSTVAISTMAIAMAAPAQAVPFTATLAELSSDVGGADFTFNIAVPTSATGDATLTLTLDGDFNSNSEHAQVSIDSLDLGTIADGVVENDIFDFADSDDPDVGSGGGNPVTGTAFIALADFAPLLADGFLVLLVDTSDRVNFDVTTVSGTLSFATSTNGQPLAQVPEPNVLPMLAVALLVAGLTRSRRKA